MAGTQVQRRRGTTAEHASFTGALGEITVDTTKKTVVVHDGTTAGGIPLAKETGSSISATSLNISGTAARINGDFSNATVADRVMFQTSTTNGTTSLGALPNGTATQSQFSAFNASTPTNASLMQILCNTTESRLAAERTGAGTFLPMTFYTNGAERVRIDTSGNVLVTSAAGLGYGTGAGGTVTQATSKSTAVTLNKPTGQITMNNAALAANTTVGFQLTNSLITASDVLYVAMANGGVGSPANYRFKASCGTGAALIYVTNESGGSLSEAIVINFAILKGATS